MLSNTFVLCDKFARPTWINTLPSDGEDSNAFEEELRKGLHLVAGFKERSRNIRVSSPLAQPRKSSLQCFTATVPSGQPRRLRALKVQCRGGRVYHLQAGMGIVCEPGPRQEP